MSSNTVSAVLAVQKCMLPVDVRKSSCSHDHTRSSYGPCPDLDPHAFPCFSSPKAIATFVLRNYSIVSLASPSFRVITRALIGSGCFKARRPVFFVFFFLIIFHQSRSLKFGYVMFDFAGLSCGIAVLDSEFVTSFTFRFVCLAKRVTGQDGISPVPLE